MYYNFFKMLCININQRNINKKKYIKKNLHDKK